jgi:hypothetical protein
MPPCARTDHVNFDRDFWLLPHGKWLNTFDNFSALHDINHIGALRFDSKVDSCGVVHFFNILPEHRLLKY